MEIIRRLDALERTVAPLTTLDFSPVGSRVAKIGDTMSGGLVITMSPNGAGSDAIARGLGQKDADVSTSVLDMAASYGSSFTYIRSGSKFLKMGYDASADAAVLVVYQDAVGFMNLQLVAKEVGVNPTQKLGFFYQAPISRPAALVQTYATADRTLSAYTADAESGAYTGAADGEAKLVDLNALRVAYENLRALTEDLTKFVNSLVDDLQAYGLEQ